MENRYDYEKPTEHDYLQFIIKDASNAIRGKIIGSSHSIEPRDAALNSSIRKTVEAAHTIWMELPPGHPLIAKPPSERAIDNSVKHIITNPPSMKERARRFENPGQVNREIQAALEEIRKKTTAENFIRVQKALKDILSPTSQLAFCQKLLEDIPSLNQLNLETVLAEVPGAKEKMVPLEDIDLEQLLKEAEANRTVEEKALLESADPTKQKWIEEQVYNAWREGNAEKLKELMSQDKWTVLMPESIRKVMRKRDINIAERIADVVKTRKPEDAVFVVGYGHLINPTENNVLNHLRDVHFQCDIDLKGWTIEQVKDYPAG